MGALGGGLCENGAHTLSTSSHSCLAWSRLPRICDTCSCARSPLYPCCRMGQIQEKTVCKSNRPDAHDNLLDAIRIDPPLRMSVSAKDGRGLRRCG